MKLETIMKTISPSQDAQDFLEAILWAYPQNEDGENPMDGKSVFDFSSAFIAGAESFLSGFRSYLSDRGFDIPEPRQSFGSNVYFSLSGHGCGFWDSEHSEHIQPLLEGYSGKRYRFEEIDLSEDEDGKLDLSFLPEFIAEYRNRLFAV